MTLGADEVRRLAALARVAVPEARVASMGRELSGILAHMDVLGRVDVAAGALPEAMPASGLLRGDAGTPQPLAVPRETFAPEMREGFFVVPRLASHDEAGA